MMERRSRNGKWFFWCGRYGFGFCVRIIEVQFYLRPRAEW